MYDPAHLSLGDLEGFDMGAWAGGMERRFLCPLCGDSKPRDASHRSLSVNMGSGIWICHRCDAKGKLNEWKEEPTPKTTPSERRRAARAHLRDVFSLDSGPAALPSTGHSATARDATRMSMSAADVKVASVVPADVATPSSPRGLVPDWRVHLKDMIALRGTPGEEYLAGRSIPVELAEQAGVRFSSSWFGQRAIVFPIRDINGTLVAAQGRYLVPRAGGPKARTTGEKKAGLFATPNFWRDIKRGAPIVITEAPIDALSLASCGYPALALCGKDGWPDWLKIKCAFHPVALALDADEAGDRGSEKLAAALSSLGAKPIRLRPENGKDWNEVLVTHGRPELMAWLAPRLLALN